MWKRYFLAVFIVIFIFNPATAQESPYKLNLKFDIPIVLVGGALTGYGFQKISQQDDVDTAFINTLNPDDVNSFDRSATRQYSDKAETISDYLFYGSFPFGVVLLFDKAARKDAGKIGLMYLQALSITSAAYSNAAGHTSRYRPYTYNPEAPMDLKKSLHSRNSFFGGHPSITAAATFFVAKVYSDYHPDSGFKYALYGFAVASSATNAYLRYRAGKHFPSDLIMGVGTGAAAGILVPHFHKKERKQDISLIPFAADYKGLTFAMNF